MDIGQVGGVLVLPDPFRGIEAEGIAQRPTVSSRADIFRKRGEGSMFFKSKETRPEHFLCRIYCILQFVSKNFLF